MGQIKLLATFMMTIVFAIAIMNYAINFATDNNTAISLSEDARLNSTTLESDLITYKTSMNSTSGNFEKMTIEPGDETSTTGGVFKAMKGIFSSIKTILGMGNNVIFGGEQGISGPGIALTALGTFLVSISILYIWKTWKGNPD